MNILVLTMIIFQFIFFSVHLVLTFAHFPSNNIARNYISFKAFSLYFECQEDIHIQQWVCSVSD